MGARAGRLHSGGVDEEDAWRPGREACSYLHTDVRVSRFVGSGMDIVALAALALGQEGGGGGGGVGGTAGNSDGRRYHVITL